MAREVGIAIPTQSSRITNFVTMDAFVGKYFAIIKTVTIFAHAFGIMLTVFVDAVLDTHQCLGMVH